MTNSMQQNKNTYKGFTLAEVLITLLIIGVIASIVIPSLLQDSQDAELKTAWKKAYSEMAQATQKIVMDNGGSLKGLFSNNNDLKNLYKNYFSYTMDCNENISPGKCWHMANKYYYLDGDPYPSASDRPAIITSSGMFYAFTYESSSCSDPINTSGFYRCAEITVDVNGFKGPNTIGKDILGIYILENRIIPRGIPNDFGWNRYCVGPDDPNYHSSGNYGGGCSAKYLYQ